jgi:hypothetical protein
VSIGFVLYLLVYPCLPIAFIVAPRVCKLWRTDQGRGQAVEELLLSLGVLLAPWLFLVGMQIGGLAPHRDDAWLPIGLCLSLPLWAIWRLLLRLARELTALVARIGRCPWTGESGWGRPLERIGGYLLLLVPAFMWFMLMVAALEIALDPNPR